VSLDAAHACVVDLDGVVWLSGRALPGASEGVAALRARGVPVLFATNNATPTRAELRRRLGDMGIEADEEEIATSAQAAATLVGAGRRAFAVGEAGLHEALDDAGVEVVEHATPSTRVDAVVVGLSRTFGYDDCDVAARLVRDGARFVATNTDPTLPTPDGPRPGAGAIVAAVATASGCAPEVAGKPWPPMARLVADRVTPGAVVGDRATTDGAFAAALGVPFAHVASGLEPPDERAAVRAATLLEAVRSLLGD
jgi:HAD superfamily hydrolase (TIGR01450 family)